MAPLVEDVATVRSGQSKKRRRKYTRVYAISEETTQQIARTYREMTERGISQKTVLKALAERFGLSETSIARHAEGIEAVRKYKREQRERGRRKRAAANGQSPSPKKEVAAATNWMPSASQSVKRRAVKALVAFSRRDVKDAEVADFLLQRAIDIALED